MSVQVKHLTASGRGAVAVLGVHGSDSEALCATLTAHFKSVNGQLPHQMANGRIVYGKWATPDGLSEDVVIVRCGDVDWEICCHGGSAAVERIVRCFPNCTDPIDNEKSSLDRLLLNCRTLRTAEYILAQRNCVLKDFLERLGNESEAACREMVANCLELKTFARHLTSPWSVAIAGCPNAGKSSLLNQLIGYDRSIVFEAPGTTRDRIDASTVIDGWPFEFADTAGIRSATDDQIEEAGIGIAESTFRAADVGLLVVDSRYGLRSVDESLLANNPCERPVAIVWNKIDLQGRQEPPLCETPVFRVSALNCEGLSSLLNWLVAVTVSAPPALKTPLPLLSHWLELMQAFDEEKLSHSDFLAAMLSGGVL